MKLLLDFLYKQMTVYSHLILSAAIECSYPSQIANGFYYISRSKDGTKTAHYACLNSYKLIGPTERKCLFNGSWTGKEPTCELAEGMHHTRFHV